MFLYIILFLFVALCAFLDITNINNQYKKIIIIIIGIFLSILSGIRWETGADWTPYYIFFETRNDFTEFVIDGYLEPGYAFLNYLVKMMTEQYSFLLLLITSLIVFFKNRCIWIYAAFPLMTLLFNFSNYIGDLFPVRQTIAIAVTMFSIDFIVKKEIKKFILAVFLASTFHTTALVFFPAYYIYHLNISREKLTVFFALSVIAVYVNFVPKLLELILNVFTGDQFLIITKLSEYSSAEVMGDSFGAAASTEASRLMAVARRCLFLPFLIYYKEFFFRHNETYNGFLNLVIFGYMFYFAFSGLSTIVAGRGSIYYNIYEIIIIPYLLLLASNRINKIAFYCAFILFCSMKYYYAIYNYYDLYIPFISVFENISRENLF